MNDSVSRREVLRTTAAGLAASGLSGAEPVQTRAFGKTGARVPIIAMGCGGSWWSTLNDEGKCIEALQLAITSGITYLDTGQTYGNGTSERWIGNGIAGRRKDLMLATKITTRDPAAAERETEQSLKRLRTDWLDVLHIHNLNGEDDLAAIERKGGLLDVVRKLREQKVARFIGITSHAQPAVLKLALERHDFDCTQMALNAAQQGAYETNSRPGASFETTAMPAALKKGIAVIAMKATGRRTLVGPGPDLADGEELIRYALSLPIATAVVGMAEHEHIRKNAQMARGFQPMPEGEMRRFAERMAKVHKARLDLHFRDHVDA
jgi:predicted aldo/keto reductase-like oxidoreductase